MIDVNYCFITNYEAKKWAFWLKGMRDCPTFVNSSNLMAEVTGGLNSVTFADPLRPLWLYFIIDKKKNTEITEDPQRSQSGSLECSRMGI